MKAHKVLLTIIFLALVSVPAQQPGQASAQQASAPATFPPATLQQVAPNIYMSVGGRGAQGGVYIGEQEVLLIDSKQDAASVAQVLAEIGKLTSNPITRLVNTHADADHVFGNRFQPKGVTVIAHENCLKEFFVPSLSGTPSDWNNPGLKPYLPSVTYKVRMDVQVGARKIELWHFGTGHTTGDTVVYFPKEKVAFIGDQVFVGRVQLIHAYKGGSAQGNVANLEKMLAALPAEKFVSGHSEIQDRAGVQNHIAGMQAMQEKVRSLKAKGTALEDVRKQFAQNEGTLVGVIYDEMK